MPLNILIKGGRIIDPGQKLDTAGDLLVSDGRIAAIEKTGVIAQQDNMKIIDAQDCIVCPGFIDLHCHLREPGYEDKETIASGSRAAARGGFTTICCMPNTNPPLDTEAAIDYVKQKALSVAPIRVLPIGCITMGRQGKELSEMHALAKAGAVGFSDDGSPVTDSRIMFLAMQYSLITGLPIIDHCEDSSLSEGGIINEGWVATRLGLKGIPAAAEEIMVARDILLAGSSAASVHIAHVSTKGSVELIRQAKGDGIHITAEVAPHHLLMDEEWVLRGANAQSTGLAYNTNAKVNPPLRTQDDIRALIGGLKDGTIDAIATDHAPHALVDKNCEMGLAAFGISGLETALASLLKLVHDGMLDLNTLISSMTCKPASIISKSTGKLGRLKPGSTADITIFNPQLPWTVKAAEFLSMGKNTPLDGQNLTGRVLYTISNGELVYQNHTA
ncbi:MAG TPA: dihydroorotase [Dehalococcoidia bacterium]|nr:dihydroorotase [Dehalococcoidia bacterium]